MAASDSSYLEVNQEGASRRHASQAGSSPVQRRSPEQDLDQTVGNIDKLRTLIFGDQIRSYDKKFKRLEDRLDQELTDIREEISRQFSSLEAHVSREIDSVVSRLQTEQKDRTETVKALEAELKDLSQDIDQKVTQLDQNTGDDLRDIRHQLLDQSKALRDELRQRVQEMGAALEEESKDILATKVNRTALAGLLTELAFQLNEESEAEA